MSRQLIKTEKAPFSAFIPVLLIKKEIGLKYFTKSAIRDNIFELMAHGIKPVRYGAAMHPLDRLKIPARMRKKKISILMPFLNEEKIIINNTYTVRRALQEMGLVYEIILIDDGSRDRSYELLTGEFQGRDDIKIVRNLRNFGKGWALKTGYEYSGGEYILFLDSDLELSPWHLPNFLTTMYRENADAVIGSKLHPSSIIDYPLKRRIMSFVYYYIIRLLFGLPVMDTQTGIKLFTRDALEISLPKVLVKKFAFDIELLIILVKHGKRVVPAPIELKFSRTSFGNIRLRTAFSMLIDTLAIFFRDRILGFYDRPMGPNVRYFYSIILLPKHYDSYEKECLKQFLKIGYDNYELIVVGRKSFGIRDPRIRYCRSESDNFNARLRKALIEGPVRGDVLIISTLESYPDERFLFSAGRILSIPGIGSTGGYVIPRPDPQPFESFSYSVLSSFFINFSFSYRYKPINFREVGELQLNGLFIRMECIDINGIPESSDTKLEHTLGLLVRKSGKKIAYSPDIMLYKKFPQNRRELFGSVRDSAYRRAVQFRNKNQGAAFADNFYILPAVLLLFVAISIALSAVFRQALYIIPLFFYYLFMLLSRILFYGVRDGLRSFLYLAVLQFSYGISFLGGLFGRK